MNADLYDRLLQYIKKKMDVVLKSDLLRDFEETTEFEIEKCLSQLQTKNLIRECNSEQYMYIRKPEEDEKIIYTYITDSKSQGCSIRDLKLLTKLPQNLISKLLKKMEEKKIIKSVKGQKSRTKIYLVYEEIPDDDVTGGIWFTNGEVDVEFVSQTNKLIYNFVKNKTKNSIPYEQNPTIDDINSFLISTGVLSVHLTQNDLKKLLDVMVYGKVLQELKDGNKIMYRALEYNQNEI